MYRLTCYVNGYDNVLKFNINGVEYVESWLSLAFNRGGSLAVKPVYTYLHRGTVMEQNIILKYLCIVTCI